MATTQNTYTGNGSTVLYAFTFPYLETTDIKVSLNGTVTTAYTLANATTIQFNTAPANGAAIRIYRQTDDTNPSSTFYPGSAIRSQDLNDNFTQILYVSQETQTFAASTDASAIQGQVTAAVNTANTANANASTALTAANSALNTANGIAGTANTALSTAQAAETTANGIAATANSALSTANASAAAVSTALPTAGGTMTGLITFAAGQTISGYELASSITTTGVNKLLANRERCTVTADGLTLTLPISPQPGWEVTISTLSGFTNTIVGRNGENIMSLAEDMTINIPNASVTLLYVDATRGWRII
jgi:hypothetical protein